MSVYSHIWLGSETDPRPTFRDEEPHNFMWPRGAVMAVVFRPEHFTHLPAHIRSQLPTVEFIGRDGWPTELPARRKERLPDGLKKEFQTFPWGWREMTDRDWRDTECDDVASIFAAARRQSLITTFITKRLPHPLPPVN